MKLTKLLPFLTLIVFFSCNKDEDTPIKTTPKFNELGLQNGIDPINTDTLVVYSPKAIEVVDTSISTNDFETEYTINVDAKNPEKIKKGNVIVDYSNGGRIWLVKDPGTSNKPAGTTAKNKGIKAFLGSLDLFFKNVIVEVSTPSNRAKNASTNPKKLESGKLNLYSGTEPKVTTDLPAISIENTSISKGISLSSNKNTVDIGLTNVNLYSNSNNSFSVTIPKGSLKVNNAVDMRFKYLPLATTFLGINKSIGNLKEFESSIYTTIDTDLKLNIKTTTNGKVNLIEPIEKKIASYTKVIPIPPYFAASVKVTLKAKLKATTNTELNVTPQISTKNNFEARATYNGLSSTPTFKAEYKNLETSLVNSVSGNFNLNQRLEIIPEVEVYAFGLLGPKGELITYEEFNANASIQNAPLTWDAEIDLGVDYKTSLDVSIFHIDKLSKTIGSRSGNLFNYDLFTSPSNAEIVQGNNQTGSVNTTLTNPIKIKVKNSVGKTVSGVPVFFETSNGSFNSNYIITNADGVAINTWTLGSTVGEQNAIAYLKDGTGNKITTTELSITATAGNATTISPVASPIPNNNATDVALSGNLSFTEGVNTPTDATFKVYFDTNSQPTTTYNLNANVNTLAYSNLQEGTQYYWKVETISSTGSVLATSPVWSFTTENSNNVLAAFPNIPQDNAINVPLNGGISWFGGSGTPPGSTYRLYFDSNPNPQTEVTVSGQSYSYSNLQQNTTYYWKVETVSNTGQVLATSPIWSFTTMNINREDILSKEKMVAFEFSSDGLHFYYSTASTIYHYSLTTPFDLTNMTFKGEQIVADGSNNYIKNIQISDNGNKFFVLMGYRGNFRLSEYKTQEPFVILNMTNPSQLVRNGESTSRFIELVQSSKSIIKCNCDYYSSVSEYLIKYNIENTLIADAEVTQSVSTKSAICFNSFSFSPDGMLIYASENTDNLLRKYKLSTPFDLETIDLNNEMGNIQLRQGERIFFLLNENTFFTLRNENGVGIITKYD